MDDQGSRNETGHIFFFFFLPSKTGNSAKIEGTLEGEEAGSRQRGNNGNGD